MPGSDAAWKTYCVVAARGSFVLFWCGVKALSLRPVSGYHRV